MTAYTGKEAKGGLRCKRRMVREATPFPELGLQTWQCTLAITALRRQRLGECKFEAHLSYTVGPTGKPKPKTNSKRTGARDKS